MLVFLVGFMGAGKTSSGRALARLLGTLFWDLDARVEAVARMSVAEIFRARGEAGFRAAETRQLAGVARHASAVVATGGGTFVQPANRELIRRCGRSVFIDVPWAELLRRLPGKHGERPLFASPEQALELWRARLPHYRQADLHIQPRPDEDAEAVAHRIALLLGGAR
ncbi:MAG TPA: shikimate kinase [Thermoanaerobaculaceae bacterium]|nr:shikimate kinase [Thermoanaerobaculaceae bacterium]HRS17122.1 shikimate kinase [Thermoanaerobaculaceae bacterium]